MNTALVINCYARVRATGQVGRLGAIYHHEGSRLRTFGLDWGSEYKWEELERISPKEYHATAEKLKLKQPSN